MNTVGHRKLQITSWLLSALMMMPVFAACGGGGRETAVDNRTAPNAAPAGAPPAKKPGLTNTQKAVVTLAGAAALYYLYNQHKKNQAKEGSTNQQYYLSKNGRVYYRDAQRKVHWVSPPREGIQVPASEARQYEEFQGYQNRSTGRDLSSLPEARSAAF